MSKIHIAVILSGYQELGLKRFINYYKIKDKIIIFKYSNISIEDFKYTKNITKKVYTNKFFFLIYFFLVLLINFFFKKKFIFGDPDSNFCNFLSNFISGKNITYLDDGSGTISFNFNRLKRESSIFTIYNINVPKKIKKIQYFPNYKKKIKRTVDKTLLIGAPFISRNICSKEKFIEIIKNFSKFKKIYYYPHRFETDELQLLPKNFMLLKRRASVEKFLYNYKYNFKYIYSFNSSSLTEIINFYIKKKILVYDTGRFFDKTAENIERKRVLKNHLNYLKKLKIKIIKL